jgi:uncharacterized protein (DUF427 family)
MMKAMWNDTVIAESDDTVVVESKHYFPRDSIKAEYFRDSDVTSSCPWKGKATYSDVVIDGKVNADAAWHYDHPKEAAQEIAGHVAFWKGVTVTP